LRSCAVTCLDAIGVHLGNATVPGAVRQRCQ
jgi:hypothetical protein